MRMWEVLFTILSYNSIFVRPRAMNYVRTLMPTSIIPKCSECAFFLHENINTGQKNQCKKLGQVNNETKEIEYSFAIDERTADTGRCGPNGFYFHRHFDQGMSSRKRYK
jgi:hypothetical protein